TRTAITQTTTSDNDVTAGRPRCQRRCGCLRLVAARYALALDLPHGLRGVRCAGQRSLVVQLLSPLLALHPPDCGADLSALRPAPRLSFGSRAQPYPCLRCLPGTASAFRSSALTVSI